MDLEPGSALKALAAVAAIIALAVQLGLADPARAPTTTHQQHRDDAATVIAPD